MRRLVMLAGCMWASVAHADYQVHATGTFVVTVDGVKMPIANARVKLMDSDNDADEMMAQGFTASDGSYDLTGSAGDSYCADLSNCHRPDPYVKLFFQSKDEKIDITDEIGFTHSCKTHKKEEKSGNVPFGEGVCNDPGPSTLYVRAQQHIALYNQIGETVPGPTINIMYRAASLASYTFYRTVHIRNLGAVFHELGHRSRHSLDGDFGHWSNDNTGHLYADAWHDDDYCGKDEAFAFNEGWAEYHEKAHPTGTTTLSDSWPSSKPQGDDCEGKVWHELLRLSRLTCSGQVVGFGGMFKTLKAAGKEKIHSIKQFRTAFDTRFPGCRPTAVPFPVPPPKPAAVQAKPKIEEDGLANYLGAIDKRVSALPKAQPQAQVLLGRNQRLGTLRQQGAMSFQKDSIAAYKKALTELAKTELEAWKSGKTAERGLQARDAYVAAIAEPRLKHLRALRTEAGAEAKAATGTSAAYFRRLESLAARREAELTEAVSARGKADVKLPESLAPEWHSDLAAPRR